MLHRTEVQRQPESLQHDGACHHMRCDRGNLQSRSDVLGRHRSGSAAGARALSRGQLAAGGQSVRILDPVAGARSQHRTQPQLLQPSADLRSAYSKVDATTHALLSPWTTAQDPKYFYQNDNILWCDSRSPLWPQYGPVQTQTCSDPPPTNSSQTCQGVVPQTCGGGSPQSCAGVTPQTCNGEQSQQCNNLSAQTCGGAQGQSCQGQQSQTCNGVGSQTCDSVAPQTCDGVVNPSCQNVVPETCNNVQTQTCNAVSEVCNLPDPGTC